MRLLPKLGHVFISFLFVMILVQVKGQLSKIMEWTDADLSKLDTSTTTDGGKVERIFLFYADWCSACRRYKPTFIRQISVEIPLSSAAAQYEFIQINLDKAPQMARRFHISHIPAIYHQMGGEFRKIVRSDHLSNLKAFIENEHWNQLPLLTLSDPSSRFGQDSTAGKGGKTGFNLQLYISNLLQELNISPVTLVFLLSVVLLILALLLISAVWLYTDYKLNSHHLTDEGIRKRIKLLKKRSEWDGSDLTDTDSDSDTENDDISEAEKEENDDGVDVKIKTSLKNIDKDKDNDKHQQNVKQRMTKTRK